MEADEVAAEGEESLRDVGTVLVADCQRRKRLSQSKVRSITQRCWTEPRSLHQDT